MPQNNRPRGREKNVTGQGKDIYKRGSGTGTGPVGGGSMSNRPTGTGPASSSSQGGNVTRAGGGKTGLIIVIAAVVLLLGGGGSLFGGLLGNSSGQEIQQPTQTNTGTGTQGGSILDALGGLSGLFGGDTTSISGGSVSTGWTDGANTGRLNTSVASAARSKYTVLNGNGNDKATIMVYMCGTDLESKYGMASNDLAEMASATLNENVNVIVYTGGCTQWKTSGISNKVNQIYKIEKGGISRLVEDDGNKLMTSPDTLSGFINWCEKNYPANRRMLIFWDHGGGSVSGYGYDEKNSRGGSMTLSGIRSALEATKSPDGKKPLTFDFIGFDACLMATTENALMLTKYADYLIASEETEPGIGWYYTDWLNALAKNPSMPTLEIGKNIVDGFIDDCAVKCKGQKATLSVVDLAELEKTVPQELNDFASSTITLLQSDNYKTVSDARSGSREFSTSKIDQVDLIHLAKNLGTAESKELANALLSSVKYNRTSSGMTNAYGLSIYFPYQKASTVDSAVRTYQAIGMDNEYTRCIQQFASLEVGGQVASGGTASPFGSLFGSIASSGTSSSAGSSDMISSLLGSFLGGSSSPIAGLTSANSGFLSEFLGTDRAVPYYAGNAFDASSLVWQKIGGQNLLCLSEEQWSLVHDLELNVFLDDGSGYLDLGLDNVFEFTEEGALIGEYDGTWLAINDQPVAYYHVSTFDDGENYVITGRVPVLLNGERAELMLVFDNDHPYGFVAGARRDYRDGETDTIAKETTGLNPGDVIDFLCDYYDYSGRYLDNYRIGDQLTVKGELTISNVILTKASGTPIPSYRFTDIYNQTYWTDPIPEN